jgi:two-component system, LytTR family, response regulator
MIKCLIADDEPLAVSLLEDYILQTSSLKLLHKCHSGIDAFNYCKNNDIDLLFLDIDMPKLTGMELVSLLSPKQKIIFTTAYREYAVQSYEKNAIDYLLKPITFERFMQAVVKAEKAILKDVQQDEVADLDEDSVFVKSGKTIIKVAFNQIFFIEGLKDYVTFHTLNERLVVYKRMKELEETLPPFFLRVHNSYIINTHLISKVEDNHAVIGNKKIPISEKYKANFWEIMKSKLF